MKKIIAALDGLDFSEATLEYAVFIARQTHAHVVGAFVEDYTYHSYSFSELVSNEGGVSDEKIQQLNSEDRETRERSVQRFESACTAASLNYSVHRDRNIALQELIHESIYCDLLIIDSKETFTRFEEEAPTRFMRDFLTDVQCPVFIVPQRYHTIDKVVLLYDGEPSSVHAAKMFSYMLPTLKEVATEIVSVKGERQSLHLPDNRLMKEFMKRHFPNADYVVLKGNPEDRIIAYLQEQKSHVLAVMGAYRRSRVSRWFKPSMADYLMSDVKIPLFIAHNK